MPAVELGYSTKRIVPAVTITKVGAPLVDPKDIKIAIDNVYTNVNRGVPVLDMQPIKNNPAVLVGGGNWDASEFPEGATVFAVGKRAGMRLHTAGIMPDYLIITGHHKTWPLPPAQHYLIAAMCEPTLFRLYPSTSFHSVIDGFGGHHLPKGQKRIPGGIAAGLTAMNVVFVMGYRELHLFGYDSSGEGEIVIECEGERYNTTFSLFQQAVNFVRMAQVIVGKGGRILVHGKNELLPTMVRKLYQDDEGPPDEAEYSILARGANFDFVTWLINCLMYMRRKGHPGPLRVNIKGIDLGLQLDAIKKPEDGADRGQMLDNVMRPAMSMLGVVEDNTVQSNRNIDCLYIEIGRAFRNGEEVPKFKHDLAKIERGLLTITLREAGYVSKRNSNVKAWTAFARKRIAEGYKVIFIRDTAKADQPLEDFEIDPVAALTLQGRLDLYERAECNLLIGTGPLSLLYFSDMPFVCMVPLHKIKDYDPWTAAWWKAGCGVDVTKEDQMAWFNPTQRLVWKDDTEENIEEAWNYWLQVREPAEAAIANELVRA